MKCVLAVIFMSIFLVEYIHAVPKSYLSRKQAAPYDLEALFRDDTFDPIENDDEVGLYFTDSFHYCHLLFQHHVAKSLYSSEYF